MAEPAGELFVLLPLDDFQRMIRFALANVSLETGLPVQTHLAYVDVQALMKKLGRGTNAFKQAVVIQVGLQWNLHPETVRRIFEAQISPPGTWWWSA